MHYIINVQFIDMGNRWFLTSSEIKKLFSNAVSMIIEPDFDAMYFGSGVNGS